MGPYRLDIQATAEKFENIKRQDGNLFKVSDNLMQRATGDVISLVRDIQEHLNLLVKEFKESSSDKSVKKEEVFRRMKELTRAVDSQIENSIIEMYLKSIASFRDLILFLTLGLSLHQENLGGTTDSPENCSIFDYYLSKNMYIMKHRAIEKFGVQPLSMRACLHPKLLACQRMPDLRRRANYISHVVTHITRLAQKGKLSSR